MEPDAQHPAESSEGEIVEQSSTGLEPRLAATLSYLFGFVSGLLFLVLEKKSSFVRFHAMQSTVVFICLGVIRLVGWVIPGIGGAISWLAQIAGVIVWILLMFKAFQGERYKLPMIGDIAEERTRDF